MRSWIHAITAGISIVLSGVTAGAAEEAQPTVAVLDFDMDAKNVGDEDWAKGAADLIEVELVQQGVHLLERRQIRLVLGERQNYRSGLLLPDSLKIEGIPYPRAFIIGTFVRKTDKQFNLKAKLVSVQNGTDLAYASSEGR